MTDPDFCTGLLKLNPDLLPVKIAFAPSRALRKHYYTCHACNDYVTHSCTSGWKSNPVLMPVDEKDVPLKLLNGPDKKTLEVFDYRLYLQKHEKFHDLTVDDDGHTIRCRVCEVVVIKLTHLTKEPKLATIEKHVASKVHREKLSPKDKAFKPSCVLCPMCNKYVSMKNYKRHLTLPTHVAMEEERKKEDLSALSAEEANQKLLDKMKEAMLTSGVSGSTLKKLIPFLREYCIGGGAIPSRRNGQIALGDAHASDDESVHGHVQIVHK